MFLRKNYFNKTGHTYLCISEAYRDQNGKPKSKIIQSLGYLDELEKEYADPIAYFTAVAQKMTREASQDILLRLDPNALLARGFSNRKNYGHVIFSHIYHELELDRFWNNKARHAAFEYNANNIMKLLYLPGLSIQGQRKTPMS